jgi:hypothetical protein
MALPCRRTHYRRLLQATPDGAWPDWVIGGHDKQILDCQQLPDLGSADRFDNFAATATVLAGRTVNAAAAMTLRADILAGPGSSACGFIARIERLRRRSQP